MKTEYADASPDKRFFIELITRDISLEDAILDLLDNSIDSLIRTRSISLFGDASDESTITQLENLPEIRLSFDKNHFTIKDNCGGISFESAKNEIFRFGHLDPSSKRALSVFGIGMKRALFKLGRQIHIESKGVSSGFTMDLNVDDWLALTDQKWEILNKSEEAKDLESAGTTIKVSAIEIRIILQTPTIQKSTVNMIKQTYPYHLGKHVRLFINENEATNKDLAVGESDLIKPASKKWTDGSVEVTVICGLLPKTKETWTMENSGWYILCNGRVVVCADRSQLTGWGPGSLLPQFMPKNRGFIGIVFFTSGVPEDLPWKTTKRGINSESPVFVRTLKEMGSIARPVIHFQNQMFASNDDTEPQQNYKDIVDKLSSKNAATAATQIHLNSKESEPKFFQAPPRPLPPTQATISFKVQIEKLSAVKQSLGNSRMSNKEVGEKLFEYFVEREC